jgi:hypothetical protein
MAKNKDDNSQLMLKGKENSLRVLAFFATWREIPFSPHKSSSRAKTPRGFQAQGSLHHLVRLRLSAARELAARVDINNLVLHIAPFGFGGHQFLVDFGQHIIINIGAAAGENHFKSSGLSVIPYGVNHAGFDGR